MTKQLTDLQRKQIIRDNSNGDIASLGNILPNLTTEEIKFFYDCKKAKHNQETTISKGHELI